MDLFFSFPIQNKLAVFDSPPLYFDVSLIFFFPFSSWFTFVVDDTLGQAPYTFVCRKRESREGRERYWKLIEKGGTAWSGVWKYLGLVEVLVRSSCMSCPFRDLLCVGGQQPGLYTPMEVGFGQTESMEICTGKRARGRKEQE